MKKFYKIGPRSEKRPSILANSFSPRQFKKTTFVFKIKCRKFLDPFLLLFPFSFLALVPISGLKAAKEKVKRDVKKSVACAIKIF